MRAALAGAMLLLAPPALAEGPARGAEAVTPGWELNAEAAPAAGAPERVVSINMCTDQLALMLAAPGQLLSVTRMAQDPRSSPLWEEARALPANAGLAEEVFLYAPDLVIAGTFTSHTTVSMLRRLGVEVAVIPPAYGVADIPDRMRAVGTALGRGAQAEAAVARFEADLAALGRHEGVRPVAALYSANGYTQGDRTLAGQILVAAGFDNLSDRLGLPDGGFLALEQLVLAAPDLVVTAARPAAPSRADEVLAHPVLASMPRATRGGLAARDWICGTPFVLNAVRHMADLRATLESAE